MYFFGRGVSAFFNQLFKWLFWNKTGQKVLFTIVIFAIAVCFMKLGEVSAVEEVSDINYEVRSYYDGVVNDVIFRLEGIWENLDNSTKERLLSNDYNWYFYYGNQNGSSLENAKPIMNNPLYMTFFGKNYNLGQFSLNNYDYIGVTGYSMVNVTNRSGYILRANQYSLSTFSSQTISIPLFVSTYQNINWVTYINAKRSGDTDTIIALLEDINESLSNTTPDQESEDSVVVDSSVADSVDSSAVDSVFSSAFTNFANKFTYYDLSDADQWVINIQGTRIVLRSDIIYNIIKNTWFYPMLQLLWYYIFGHYAFVWLTNLIHKIKDGSILDGMQMNEVISKEML